MKKLLLLILVFLLLLPGCGKQAEEEEFSFPPPDYESEDIYGGQYYDYTENCFVINLAVDPSVAEALELEGGPYLLESPEFQVLPVQVRQAAEDTLRKSEVPARAVVCFRLVKYPLSNLDALCAELEAVRQTRAADLESPWSRVEYCGIDVETNTVRISYFAPDGGRNRALEAWLLQTLPQTDAVSLYPNPSVLD